jgi:hypothetical protein
MVPKNCLQGQRMPIYFFTIWLMEDISMFLGDDEDFEDEGYSLTDDDLMEVADSMWMDFEEVSMFYYN